MNAAQWIEFLILDMPRYEIRTDCFTYELDAECYCSSLFLVVSCLLKTGKVRVKYLILSLLELL